MCYTRYGYIFLPETMSNDAMTNWELVEEWLKNGWVEVDQRWAVSETAEKHELFSIFAQLE